MKDTEEVQNDGVIFHAESSKFIFLENDTDPFKITDLGLYDPLNVTSRISAQAGLFLINPVPNNVILDNRINEIFISKDVKNDIEIILEIMGVHNGALFPGLEGLAKYVEWLYSSY